MMSLHLTHPIYAGSFLLLGCLYMLVQKVRCPSRRVPSKLEGLPAGIRLGVLSLLLISLSGIQIVRTQPRAAVVFVLDLSESIAPQDKVAAFEYLKRATGTMRDGDTFGLVVFGKDAAIDQAFGPRRPLTAIQARPITTGTNIAQALHLAIAMLASQPQKRIVLLSDGNQTAGDTLRAAALAAAQGIPIDVVPLNTAWQEAGQGISIEATTAPEQIRVGEPFDVTVVLQGNTPTPVVLKLYRGGVAVAEREAVLTQGGRQTLHFPQRLDTAGFHHYTSVVERRDHTLPQHNEGGTVIYAYGRPRILYVTHAFTPPVLRDVLVKHDFEVLVSTPSLLPTSASALSPYDVVIFDNVAATTLTEKRMQALADYVETLGGGFIMLGSTQSFGPGGYGQTPLERILPVDVHVRSRVARPPLALVLLLDKSGSMATEEGHSTKIDVAKDAVQALLEVLDPADVLGIIAFDQDARPIMELQQLADKAIVQERLRPIQAGGGTAVYPALAMA